MLKLEKDFVRRLVRAYEEDLVHLAKSTPDSCKDGWVDKDLLLCEKIRSMTFSSFLHTIEF